MNILLFGVSNVGKNVTGKLLAEYLGYTFFDIDQAVKEELGITLEEFVSTGPLLERDHLRCDIIHSLTYSKANKVTQTSHIKNMRRCLKIKQNPAFI